MGVDLISVMDVARQHGKRKSTVFKVLKRLGIEPTKRRSSASNNQMIACITQEEFRLVGVEMQTILSRDDSEPNEEGEAADFVSAEVGVFFPGTVRKRQKTLLSRDLRRAGDKLRPTGFARHQYLYGGQANRLPLRRVLQQEINAIARGRASHVEQILIKVPKHENCPD